MAETRVVITAEANQAIQEFERLRAETTNSMQQIDAAGNHLNRTTMSANQTANALSMIPAQFTDIVVSLQGGQNPITVLLQQGGQLRDMFNGTSGAARALGGYILGLVNPLSLVAVGLGAVAYGYNEGSKEADAYGKAIILNGNSAGTSTGKLTDMARAIKQVVGTEAEAASALAALAGTGQVGAENLQRFATVAVRTQKSLGIGADEMAKNFAELGESPLAASEKLSAQYHYLTAATYEQIKALENLGKTEEAAAVAQNAFADSFDGKSKAMEARLGYIERGWLAVKGAILGAGSALAGIGREKTAVAESDDVSSRIEQQQQRLQRLQQLGGGKNNKIDIANVQAELAGLRTRQELLQAGVREETRSNEVQAAGLKLEEARITWSKEGDKYLTREVQLRRAIKLVREQGEAAQIPEKAAPGQDSIEARIKLVKQGYSDLNNVSMAGLEAQRALEREALAGSLANLESSHRQGLASDEVYIAEKRKLALKDLDGEAAIIRKQADFAGGKADLTERTKYLGSLKALEQRRMNIIQESQNSLEELAAGGAKAVKDQSLTWTNATIAEQQQLSDEISLFGKSAQARSIATAQIRVDTDARQVIADRIKQKHPLNEQEIADLQKQAEARKMSIAAILGEQQALAGAEQLRQENEKFAIESISDEHQRATRLLEEYAKLWRARIALAGDGSTAQTKLKGEFDIGYANQSKKVLNSADLTRATELLKILEAVDSAARQAASGMEASFGAAGKAIGGLTTALTGYASAQATVAAQLAAVKADPKSGADKIAQAEMAASKASAQAQVKSYGDMASAAKGFFKENTAGYRALEGAEKAYRAVEMAMAVKAMIEKSGLLVAFTGLFAASKATEVAATVATVPVTVAAEGVKQTALATTAMAGAVAVPFPGNIVAFGIVAAMLAAIGLGGFGGGGGSVDVAKERQAAAGTGSVLGDESAKSESIAKSIENLEKYSSIELSHTRGMLSALQTIRDTIGVVAAMATQTAGLRATAIDEKNFGVGSSSGVLGIGASSTTIQDSGIKLNGSQSIGSAISGIDAKGYVDIQKKNSGLWGIGASTSNRRDDVALDDSIKKQFGLVLASMRDGTLAAIDLLGMSSAGVVDKINGMALGVNEISFKGLTGAEIQNELEAVFSKVGDDIAKLAAPELTSFQKVGEGYLQTLTRIATDYATIDSIMEATGKTFGSVGVASIQAREDLIKFAGGLDKLAEKNSYFVDNFLSDSEKAAPAIKYAAAEMAALGRSSVTTTEQFKDLMLGLNPSNKAEGELYAKLLDLAPAFKAAADAAQAAIAKAQEAAKVTAGLDGQIYDLTHTAAEALARQRQVELSAMTATDAELQKRIYALTDEKAAAAELATVKAKQAADLATIKTARGGIADEIFKSMLGGKDLQGKIDQLKGAEAAAWSGVGSGVDSIAAFEKIKALAMQRIDLEGQLQDKAVADLKTQYDLRSQGLTTELNAMVKMRDYAQQLLGFTNGLKLGDLSALSPTAKLAEAESQYRTTLGKARDGDVTAQGGLQGIAQTYLQLQKQYSGSTGAYASTYASVITALETLAGTAPTDPQIESQKLQISTIQSTSAALSTTVRDTSAKQVEVLQRIDAAMAKSQTNVEAQLAQAGAANAALVEELKKSNAKLAEIEARMSRMEASA